MKKNCLSVLLVFLALILLVSTAYADGEQNEVSAAATENSIEFTSFSADWDHITYTVSYSITNDLAQQGYDIGIEYSTAPTFRSGNQAYTSLDSGTYNYTEAGDNLTFTATRRSVNLVPGITYYFRPVLLISGNWSNPVAFGSNVQSFVCDSDDTGFSTVSAIRQNVNAQGWLRAKFTAPYSGLFALVDDGTFDFISYYRKTVNNGVEMLSESSSANRQQNSQILSTIFRAEEGETVYLFGCPRMVNGYIQVVPAEDIAPAENSIEVGEAFDIINISASFNFTISTTVATANKGYKIGIEYGEGTNPDNWQGQADFGPSRTDLMIQRTIMGRNNGIFVPGMDIYYRAVLFDGQTREILARGSNIWHLVTPNTTDGIQALSLNNETFGSFSGIQGLVPYYFTAPTAGMYAFEGGNWSSFVLRDRLARVRVGGGGQSTYLLVDYLNEGETVYVGGYYNNNLNECSVLVTEGLTTFPQLTQVAPLGLNGQTPVWFRAPETGFYRFAIDENSPVDLQMVNESGSWQYMGKEFLVGLESDQILWIRPTSGQVSNLSLTVEAVDSYVTSDLHLDGLGTFHIIQNMTIAEGVNLSYWGTELVIDPGVTLTILGSANGDAVNNAGILRVEGDSAMFRSGSRMLLSGSGKVEIDGNGYVELASDSLANNAYLDPDMNIEFSNEGSVTFGYFTPDEATMRSLNASVDNSNPQIRHDLQLYSYDGSDFTLTDNFTPREHVTLHADYHWGNGGSFVIPADVTLTIPEYSTFNAFSNQISIYGRLENYGEICLGAVKNQPILNLILQDGGSYYGNGNVTVETLDSPAQYIDGFFDEGLFWLNEAWRDEVHGRVSYQLIRTYNYGAADGMGTYTLPGNLTIGAGEQLLADTLTIPANVTLTVNGSTTVNNALVIEEGGALVIGAGARFELNNFKAPPTSSVFNGTITLGDDARMYLGLGHWTNTNIKDKITVTGQDAEIQVNYHHNGNGPKTVDEMLDVITGSDASVPSNLEAYVRKEFSLCIPYEATGGLTIPAGINFSVLNNGSDETGSLTIPQGAVLTIPEGVTLQLRGAHLTVNGTVENNGRVELMTYNGGPEGTMPSFTLGSGADYAGNGEIWVRSYEDDPGQYLTGFNPDNLIMTNRDYMGAWYRYLDVNALFYEFKALCESPNHPGYCDVLQNMGEFTIFSDVTIPQGMHVNAWGTTLVIPENVTLSVEGSLGCTGLEIAKYGTVRTGDNCWANIDTDGVTGSGAIHIGNQSNLNLDLWAWNTSVADMMSFGDTEAMLRINGHAWSIYEFSNISSELLAIQVDGNLAEHLGRTLNIYTPITLSNDFVIHDSIDYHVHCNGRDQNGSLTIPEGVNSTMGPGSFVSLHGADFTVSGELVNNGVIELIQRDDGYNDVGDLRISDGGSYSGSGMIQVNAYDRPKSHIVGVDSTRILTAWTNERDGWYGYRIAASAPAVISDGSTFSFQTADEGIMEDLYTGGYLVTPTESGYYSFSLSFDGDPDIHWDEAWFGISGTPIQDVSLDTGDPASLVFRTQLFEGEGYELVFADAADIGALTVNVSVSAVTGNLADILNSMAGTNERYDLWDDTVIHSGETLTIPAEVELHVHAPLSIESGGKLLNASDLYLDEGGSLTFAEGGMLELQDASDRDWVAQIVLSGGSMDVTGGSVTYGERSRVTIDCGYYGNHPEQFLGSVAGVSPDHIDLNVNVSTADEVFGINGDAGLWNELSGYSGVTFNLVENLNLQLPVSEIPGEYMLILNYGTSVSIPEGNTLDLNGGLVLEGGAIENNGTMNVNNWINFQRNDSSFINNGTILVSGNGWIGANSFHEGHGSGAIVNNGSISVRDGGVIMPQVHVINNPAYILVRLELPENVTEIGEEAFAGTGVQAIDVPENIQQIGARAFADCEILRVVVIPSADVTIDPTAFEGCGDITIIAPAGGTVQTFAEAYHYFVPMG